MISWALGVVILIRLFYWFYFFRMFPKVEVSSGEGASSLVGVTILICVKEGVSELKANLDFILAQDYPVFEVVVVDDFSTDGLENFVRSIGDDKVKYIVAKRDIVGKKAAIETGVGCALYDLILVTDVDCRPQSQYWVGSMVGALGVDGDLVLGFGQLKGGGGLLGRFAEYETVMTAMQYFSYAQRKMAYMGVGRNMLYKKSIFLDLDPYKDNYHTAGGDDDVFVSKVAGAGFNIKSSVDKDSWTVSEAKKKWSGFFRQKTRHISSSVHYGLEVKMLLTLFAFTHLLFYILGAWNLLLGEFLFTGILIFGFYLITSMVHRDVFKSLGAKHLFPLWVALDVIFAFYLVAVSMVQVIPRQRWKGGGKW